MIIFHRIITTKQKPTGTHLSQSWCQLARYPLFQLTPLSFEERFSDFSRWRRIESLVPLGRKTLKILRVLRYPFTSVFNHKLNLNTRQLHGKVKIHWQFYLWWFRMVTLSWELFKFGKINWKSELVSQFSWPVRLSSSFVSTESPTVVYIGCLRMLGISFSVFWRRRRMSSVISIG